MPNFWFTICVFFVCLFSGIRPVKVSLLFAKHSLLFTIFQISVGALFNQAQNELQERYDSEDDSAIVVTLPRMPQPEKLDIKSCEQFLLELFEQWMSPYIQPKTPLALLSEATKAVSRRVVTSMHVDSVNSQDLKKKLNSSLPFGQVLLTCCLAGVNECAP